MFFLMVNAVAAKDEISELIRRAEEAKQGRDGCWVVEGHGTSWIQR